VRGVHPWTAKRGLTQSRRASEKKESRFTTKDTKSTKEKLVARFAREKLLCAAFVIFVIFVSFVVKLFSVALRLCVSILLAPSAGQVPAKAAARLTPTFLCDICHCHVGSSKFFPYKKNS
jgi:hypothetical protein